MRIGIDCRLWNETGVGRYIRNLVEQLFELDRHNTYVLFVKEKDYQNLKSQISNLRNKDQWKVVKTDIHWHSLAEQIKFPQVLYKENLDLMHFPYFSLPIFYNKPFVVTIHDLIINHFPTGKASTLPYPLYQVKRLGYNYVLSHAVKNAKKIIVPLYAVRDDLIQTLKVPEEKIVVTYEGVNVSLRGTTKQSREALEIVRGLPRRSYVVPRNDRYFLYVGNAYPHKNLEFLVETFTEFKREIDEAVQLILVGKDDFFYRRLRERVENEKISGVIFKHNISDEELFGLYSHAIAFVSPSLMEGFGLPPLEALSVSCLPLLSEIPAFKEVCQESAIYFDPSSTNSLKEKLHFVYNLDQKTKQQYITRGLARVKHFSWKKWQNRR